MSRSLCGRLALVSALAALFSLAAGCSGSKDKLDTQAPPPSNPNAQPEVAVNKRMPPRPPAFGAGPATAPPKGGPGAPGEGPGVPGGR